MNKKDITYQGFEQGPIRPPSEARSLLIRVTRNCPWNRCIFCGTYNNTKFSIRSVEDVIKDIDSVYKHVETLKSIADFAGRISQADLRIALNNIEQGEQDAFYAAVNWYACGMESVFIQDANSLIMKPANLVEILLKIKKCFPWVGRITSYARSHTIARIKDNDLKSLRKAGLNRIHIGLESGSDLVLSMVKKGVNKETHIKAGLKVKKAGMELSEYVMPGLGGKKYSKIHILETADAINRINPDFIRLRPLAIPCNIKLYHDYKSGRFEKCTDIMVAKEILLFIENLNGITSVLKSDHILNLFDNLEGKFPDDKEKLLAILRSFLAMDQQHQCYYLVGRRVGLFCRLDDMDNQEKMNNVKQLCTENSITPDNVNQIVDEAMQRFI